MNTSIELLEAIKSKYNLASTYAIAKKLHVSVESLYKMQKNQTHMSDQLVFKVAKLLEMNPTVIWLKIQSEKLSQQEKDLIDADFFSHVPDMAKKAETLDNIEREDMIEILESIKPVLPPAKHKLVQDFVDSVYYVK